MIAVTSGCTGSKKAVRSGDDIYGSRAYRYFLSGNLLSAAEIYKKGFISARNADNMYMSAQYLANIGRIYFELDRFDSAAVYLAKSHNEFVRLDDTAAASKAAAFLALCHAAKGDGAQAHQWFSAASAYKGRNFTHYLAVIKSRIDWQLSSKISNEKNLEKARAFYKKKRDLSTLATIAILKADTELSKSNCAAASRLLSEALSYFDKTAETYRRGKTLVKLASVNFCAGNDDAGKHFYERALDCVPRGILLPTFDQVSACDGIRCR
jgi:tetratricopeptide (TPR) repeat protein